MTNYEFYKGDADALRNAFIDYCDKHNCEHAGCRFFTDADKHCNGMEGCVARFICAEHEEPPKKKRRFYSFEEAKRLIGKTIVSDGESVMITRVHLTCDGAMINGYYQRAFMDATIDGEPFGVLVGGAE